MSSKVKLARVLPTASDAAVSDGLVLTGPGTVERVTEHVRPPIGAEVLVRVHTVGLCGTDAALYAGTYAGPRSDRLCFGHEWSGVVEEIGEEVTILGVGDKVVGECLQACGVCRNCARDSNLCMQIRKFGITTAGAARERLVLEERYLHRVDADVELDVLALVEPVAVAAKAVDRAKTAHDVPLEGSRVLVIGGGMIGLACVAVLRLLEGCELVVLVDPVPERLAYAQMLGAVPCSDTAALQSVAERRSNGTPLEAGFDVVINAAPSAAALASGLELLRPLGTLVCLGLVESIELSPRVLTLKAARIIGSLGGTGMFEQAIELVARHEDMFRKLITHTLAFTEADAAFAAMGNQREALKVHLRMSR